MRRQTVALRCRNAALPRHKARAAGGVCDGSRRRALEFVLRRCNADRRLGPVERCGDGAGPLHCAPSASFAHASQPAARMAGAGGTGPRRGWHWPAAGMALARGGDGTGPWRGWHWPAAGVALARGGGGTGPQPVGSAGGMFVYELVGRLPPQTIRFALPVCAFHSGACIIHSGALTMLTGSAVIREGWHRAATIRSGGCVRCAPQCLRPSDRCRAGCVGAHTRTRTHTRTHAARTHTHTHTHTYTPRHA
jgi:hypothetical protein